MANIIPAYLMMSCLISRECRGDVVKLVDTYQFDDVLTEGKDVFDRDPFILRFQCPNAGIKLSLGTKNSKILF